MSTSYGQSRPPVAASQEPQQPISAVIRDRLAMERARLDVLCPEALDLAAEILAVLHDAMRGEVTALAGDRTARYRRAQLLGSAGMPVEDLCHLWLLRPAHVAAALARLCEVPVDGKRSLATVSGEVAVDAAALMRDVLAALEDGSVSVVEREHIDRDLSVLQVAITETRTALYPGVGDRRRP